MIGMIFYMAVGFENDLIGKAMNSALSFMLIFFLTFILFVRTHSPSAKKGFNELNILTITLLLAFLLNVAFSSSKKYLRLKSAKFSTVVFHNGEKLDSTQYLGKSENYYFFSKHNRGVIVPKEDIQYLKVPDRFTMISNKDK